ncbi:complement C1q-like protein 4 [Ruditapes philippinarum]|uniref:complement C1q-like protein 4 n=1 Tax=Ruditapes philippinarum TaxID=129788 RepID=UPI00295B7DC8|nr:complement C1q-like protein 4 [Ruditapes philippinarum]
MTDSDGTTNEVLFRARNVKNTSPSSGEVIIFQTVLTNIGSAYDHQSGMFTAPVAGLYIFTLQLCIADEQYIYFEIVVDDEPILKSVGVDDYNKWSTGDSFSTAAILEAGAKVWVKYHSGSKKCICTNTDHWNMFHGFLVRQN